MSSASQEPGYYYAQGDPPGTVRYWDGSQWVGDPMPTPPDVGASTPGGRDPAYFAGIGIRVGAAVLDVVVFVVIALVIAIPLVAADAADDAGEGLAATGPNLASILVTLAFLALQVWLIGQFGGTPGKLMVGLRITEADGVTTPPSWGTAAMRVVPIGIATNLPFLGALVGLAVLVLFFVWVSSDPERRSPYDRVGNTRVVRRDRLPI